ncbi:hypothetical protein FBU59_004721 [Linderina macrospora]|uniref:Uncharacterized protein n=1 Tax=Linderina macrospora TaxID=4868 RepID=A0ACC1J4Z6_9FUNG|nr:hypothetical protein FBU59_004721 [Linderina macrospora]
MAAMEPVIHPKLPAQMRGPAPDEDVEMDKEMLDSLVLHQQAQSTIVEAVSEPVSAKRVKLDEPKVAKPIAQEPVKATEPVAVAVAEPSNGLAETHTVQTRSMTSLFSKSNFKTVADSEPSPKQPVESALPKPPAVPTFKPATAAPAKTSASAKNDDDDDDDEEIPDIVMEGSDSEDDD